MSIERPILRLDDNTAVVVMPEYNHDEIVGVDHDYIIGDHNRRVGLKVYFKNNNDEVTKYIVNVNNANLLNNIKNIGIVHPDDLETTQVGDE